MSETIKSNLEEMMAGDGSSLSMPPAFVFVNPRSQRRYKKSNQQASKIDGRTKSAKNLLSRISKRKKMKEELETIISEAVPSETERVQKQIASAKKLNRQKEIQKKREDAKKKLQVKAGQEQELMKARLSDFQKRASEKQKAVTIKASYEPTGEIMNENLDALEVALDVATSELNPSGETSFAKITFSDGTQQNLDNFSAKRIAAAYAQLDDTNKDKFRYMLNKDAVTFQSALEFAVRNV